MAKQELRRKILATIATVGGLCCALAVCVWLLLTSSMFSTSIQILMLVCTGGLAAATVGPVSYTHLDVYKRQLQRCAQAAQRRT